MQKSNFLLTLTLLAMSIWTNAVFAEPAITGASATGTTIKFTVQLSEKLFSGYKVKIDLQNGKGLAAMKCSALTCTLSSNALPKGVDDTSYNVGIYDAKGVLQGETIDAPYVITSTAEVNTDSNLATDKADAKVVADAKALADAKVVADAKALADAKIVADAKALADAKVVADAKTAAALASATLKIAAAKAAGTTPVLTAEEALASYNPNAGVWHANSTTNSPFGGVLQGLIAGYKNPYAAGNTNPTASVPITRVSPVASVPTPKLP